MTLGKENVKTACPKDKLESMILFHFFFLSPDDGCLLMGLIDWQRNLRLLDWVTRFFNTSGATYGGVPQHLRPSGRSLPLWRKTVANPKSEIFKLSEKEIYKKIHFWVNKIIQLTTHTGFSIRASGWQNLPSISLTLYFWKLPQQLESRSARHDSWEGGNLLLSGAIYSCAVTE